MQTGPSRSITRISFKLAVLAGVALLLQIPVHLTQSLVDERDERLASMLGELQAYLGREVSVHGPALLVQPTQGGAPLWLFGDVVQAESDVHVTPRYRGIFKLPTYDAHLKFSGQFRIPAEELAGLQNRQFDWDKATFAILVSGHASPPVAEPLHFDRAQYPMAYRITLPGAQTGLAAEVDGASVLRGAVPFSFSMRVQGSVGLAVAVLGRSSTFSMTSNWPHPSFSSDGLPNEREVNARGFRAVWQATTPVLAYDDRLPAASVAPMAGVKFIESPSHYQQVTRAVKYALLVIALTFCTLFLFEIMAGLRIHPVQYVLVGASLAIFYLLLLSLSEHLGFARAYAVAATAVVVLVGGYASAVLRARWRAVAMSAGLAVLYGLLFVIMAAESYSLLTGSLALFVLLALVMYITRRVDWYALDGRSEQSP